MNRKIAAVWRAVVRVVCRLMGYDLLQDKRMEAFYSDVNNYH